MTFLHSLDRLKVTFILLGNIFHQHEHPLSWSWYHMPVSGSFFFQTGYKTGTVSPNFTPEIWMNDNLFKLRPVTFFVRPMIVSICLSEMCHGWRKYWLTCIPISFERFDKLRGEMAICNGEIGPHSNQKEVLYLSARQKIHYGQVNDITK